MRLQARDHGAVRKAEPIVEASAYHGMLWSHLGQERIRRRCPTAVMTELEHVRRQRDAGCNQTGLGFRLRIAGKEDRAATVRDPEHQRCVVDRSVGFDAAIRRHHFDIDRTDPQSMGRAERARRHRSNRRKHRLRRARVARPPHRVHHHRIGESLKAADVIGVGVRQDEPIDP